MYRIEESVSSSARSTEGLAEVDVIDEANAGLDEEDVDVVLEEGSECDETSP